MWGELFVENSGISRRVDVGIPSGMPMRRRLGGGGGGGGG